MYRVSAVGFDVTTTIKRSDFGLTAYLPMVSDIVHIQITGEAIEAEGFRGGIEQPKSDN